MKTKRNAKVKSSQHTYMNVIRGGNIQSWESEKISQSTMCRVYTYDSTIY